MKGDFGVFDGADLLARFDDWDTADEWRADALQLTLPEYFRRPEYDDLDVVELPRDFDSWYEPMHRMLVRLRVLRNTDLAIRRCLARMEAAQRLREGVRSAAA
jgi:hypothetical protein